MSSARARASKAMEFTIPTRAPLSLSISDSYFRSLTSFASIETFVSLYT